MTCGHILIIGQKKSLFSTANFSMAVCIDFCGSGWQATFCCLSFLSEKTFIFKTENKVFEIPGSYWKACVILEPWFKTLNQSRKESNHCFHSQQTHTAL